MEVEFQYGSRFFFLETESSNISPVDWDIWPKFGKPVAANSCPGAMV